ncbi:hypothetical protein [Enterococcus gilvus]|uniref:hypothetical protein n=1 Tax=Enterococcus gilvus TaxID=160453 RepID=UPI003EDA76ED
MIITRNGYFKKRSSNGTEKIYKAIDNQPLPEEYQNSETDKRYKYHYYFLIADLSEPDVRKIFSMEYLDSASIDFVSASKSDIELYKAAELISDYQEKNSF